MKEEIIKLLESIRLNDVEKENENYESFMTIKEDFQYAINKIKECNEDTALYEEIKEKISAINEQETDFRKYRIAKSLSRKIIAELF